MKASTLTKLLRLPGLKSALLVLTLLCLVPTARSQAWSGILPSNRAVDWTTAGVEGGIPSNTWTQCGSTIAAGASAATIQTALNGCAANHYVLLGPGTFNLSNGLCLTHSGLALRGSGADQTIINDSASACTCYTSESPSIALCTGNADTRTTANWTAGYAQGSTQIILSTVSGLVIGRPMFLSQADDASDGWPATGDFVVCEASALFCSDQGGGGSTYNPDGGGRSNVQWVRPTAINQGGCGATCVTISPPIALPNYRSSQSPHAIFYTGSNWENHIGVEDLSLIYTGGTVGIKFVYCDNCWIKGVRIADTSGGVTQDHNVFPLLSFHLTIKNSYFYGDQCGTGCQQNYQLMPMLDSNILWENNISQGIQAALIPNGPYSVSVFAYNFFTGRPDASILPHNAGEMMNLYEGNVMNGYVGDIDHGTHFLDTMFRNALVSYTYAGGPGSDGYNVAIGFRTNNRFMNVVGNVMGAAHFTTYETDLANNDDAVYDFGWQGDISSGTGGVNNDTNVKRTVMRWGNWDKITNATRWCGNSSNTGWSTTCGSTTEIPSGITNFPNPIPTVGDTGSGQSALPASFYNGVTAAHASCGTSLDFWKNPTSGTCPPYPPIGPDASGGTIPNTAGHANFNPAAYCWLVTLGGSSTGSGSPLTTFSESKCYANDPATSGPAPPTNLIATPGE